MIYLVFFGGVVLGCCVGLLIAGMMAIAKQADEDPRRRRMVDAEVLAAMVSQHCAIMPDGSIWSCGLSSNEDAMLALALVGRMEVVDASETGEIIYARWANPPMDPVAAEIANDNARADAQKVVP